eukprot:SAG11_NODE_3149_length_2647_cov_8.649784_1_plen_334_part_00
MASDAQQQLQLPVIYLHGFGGDERCYVGAAVRKALPTVAALIQPTYHPGGVVRETRLEAFLSELATTIAGLRGGRAHFVGCSVGGLLAAVFAARRPAAVASLLLLAPAIDNFERNFRDVSPADRHMPPAYVAELEALPARPPLPLAVVPTTIVHGLDDDDGGGSAPWRVLEWVEAVRAASGGGGSQLTLCMPAGVDHSLQPWLGRPAGLPGAPGLAEMIADLHRPESPPPPPPAERQGVSATPAAAGAGRRWYFAFGSNLRAERMAGRQADYTQRLPASGCQRGMRWGGLARWRLGPGAATCPGDSTACSCSWAAFIVRHKLLLAASSCAGLF